MENKSFKLEGAKEVIEALKQLPIDVQSKFIKGFLRKVGKMFIVDELKRILPKTLRTRKGTVIGQSEFIQSNNTSKNELRVIAGLMNSGYKLKWLDLGTKVRTTKKGANRGQIVGKNQIQPLIEKQIEPIIKYFDDEFSNEINKSIKRKLKRL